jgi:hypothetical protein
MASWDKTEKHDTTSAGQDTGMLTAVQADDRRERHRRHDV